MTAAAPTRTRAVGLALAPTVAGGMGVQVAVDDLELYDCYDLPELDLGTVGGISLSATCDQLFLGRHRALLEEFVRSGGRLLVNGHVVEPFLPGLARWRRLVYEGPRDLVISRLSPHPIWDGVDLDDVLFRTGVPGAHTFEELRAIGVAGFYGRGYHLDLPEGARVLNGIGPLQAPIDYTFALGAGEVVVHGGLDLLTFADPTRSTARFATTVIAWLRSDR
ncbi:hypothetical protein [Pseudonocardia parietis]|uniref:Uncharacterized protein n=1 Tax=Pseudonocardia parietis TaxID=570936 RepID=A0ABS4VSN5_9PSEU|nr:hypothetical protein [Pseudonocardia parietis]MBP2366921.1 hypothetical protein [Pseudonocardia parietis]